MLPSSRLRVKLRVDVKAVAAESLRGWLMISWVVMNLPFVHTLGCPDLHKARACSHQNKWQVLEFATTRLP